MWFFGIIPDEVFHEFLIKDSGLIKVIYMPVNELFLNGSVESLKVAVGLRMLRIIKEVYQAVFLARLSKVFFEFTAIIGLDPGSDERGNFNELPKEIAAIGRGVRLVGIGESKSSSYVNGGKDIAFDASSKDSHCIHLYKVAGELRRNPLSSQFRLGRSWLSYPPSFSVSASRGTLWNAP